ncbi:hypothetical protein [Lysobacter tyrosinilyticus]
MLKHKFLATCIAAGLTLAIGATIPATATAAPAASSAQDARYAELIARAQALQVKLQDWKANAAMKHAIRETQWSAISSSAIDPDDYQCSGTALGSYVNAEVGKVNPFSLYILSILGAFDLPSYDALVYGDPAAANSYGINGEYTLKLTHEFRDLKSFWDVDTRTMGMVPMHGADVFSSVERTERAAELVYGPDLAPLVANLIHQTLQLDPALQNGAHPIFTFNAFAFPGAPSLGIPERIVMGDGILQGMAAVGLDENGARTILAHEFGHQVQFKDGLYDSPLTGAEATRRTELMADAFGTYYLTHKRGLALNSKRLLPSQQSLYQVGDCGFSSDGHHGTPNQRLRSSVWGANLAASAQKQGHIQPSLSVAGQFESVLPELTQADNH